MSSKPISPNTRKEIEERVAVLSARNPVIAPLCALVGDMILASQAIKLGPAADNHETLLHQNEQTRDQSGSYWDMREVQLDWPDIWSGFERLVAMRKEREGADALQVKALLKLLRAQARDKPGPLRAVLTSNFDMLDANAEKFGISSLDLHLMLRLSLWPALRSLSNEAQVAADWSKGYCPVCASKPGMASLTSENGKRRLHCSLCQTSWDYERLRCPFCGTDHHSDLDSFRVRHEDGLSVELCSDCGNYLKTLDLRILPGPVIPILDDVGTWHFDLMIEQYCQSAQQRGAVH